MTFEDAMNARVKRFRELARREDERVKAILERDRENHKREITRAAAEIEFENGKSIAIVDTVLEPTPEWMEKGDVATFTPRLEDGTVKTVRGYRRNGSRVIGKLWADDAITEEQFFACKWYREQNDLAGLEGRFKTNYLSLTGNVGGGTGGGGQAPMALNEREAHARIAFRAARAALPEFYLLFFDKVVLENIPFSRSWRFSKSPKHKVKHRFRMVAQVLVNHLKSERVEYRSKDEI